MPKSRSRRRSRRTRKRKRGGKIKFGMPKIKVPDALKRAGSPILGLVARYIRDIIKPGTAMPKTRQLMLDSFVYAALLANKKQAGATDFSAIPQPKYGTHYLTGAPVKGGSGETAAIQASATTGGEGTPPVGGRRRRSRKRRRKSRRKSKRKKSRRRRKKSRRRRRR